MGIQFDLVVCFAFAYLFHVFVKRHVRRELKYPRILF
jgi:hypothetical protein